MWNFYQFLHPNSGVTPPYAMTPNGSGSFPFTPPWVKPTGGTAMVPFNERFPTVRHDGPVVSAQTTPKSGLPALPKSNPLSNVSGLGALLDILRPAAGEAAAATRLGPIGSLMMGLGQALKPTPMGAEPPQYKRDASGNMTLNPGAALDLFKQAQLPTSPSAPLPMARPSMSLTDAASVPMPMDRPMPLPMVRPQGQSIPLPRPRPDSAPSAAPDPVKNPYGFVDSPAYMGQGSTGYGVNPFAFLFRNK